MFNKILLVFILTLTLSLQGQESTWESLNYFAGSWKGHETGKAGIGVGSRTYEFIMDGKYLFADNISKFEPQEKNPEGEIHKDWAFISNDKGRKVLVLREFHSEGFVIQYALDSLESSEKKYVFISEAVENAPPGMRAKVTIEIQGENEFLEIFDLAFTGKDYVEFLRNHWTRLKE